MRIWREKVPIYFLKDELIFLLLFPVTLFPPCPIFCFNNTGNS